VALAQASGARHVGALFRRTRPDGAGGARVQAEALHLIGDGVAPPVVRFLSENLLLPLVAAGAVRGVARLAVGA